MVAGAGVSQRAQFPAVALVAIPALAATCSCLSRSALVALTVLCSCLYKELALIYKRGTIQCHMQVADGADAPGQQVGCTV